MARNIKSSLAPFLLLPVLLVAGCSNQVNIARRPWRTDTLLFSEDFNTNTLDNWVAELERPDESVVEIKDGKLNIDVGRGATIWFKPKLSGNILITYLITVVDRGGTNDRVSDLNQFWMASYPAGTNLFIHSGTFSQYNDLLLYYVGMGGNNNGTTRFRRYPGDGTRPLLGEFTDPDHLIEANKQYEVKIICFKGTTQFMVNDEIFFSYKDANPLTAGHFGFRTVHNHEIVDDFKVYRLANSGP